MSVFVQPYIPSSQHSVWWMVVSIFSSNECIHLPEKIMVYLCYNLSHFGACSDNKITKYSIICEHLNCKFQIIKQETFCNMTTCKLEFLYFI
jgi:hypothetical protein